MRHMSVVVPFLATLAALVAAVGAVWVRASRMEVAGSSFEDELRAFPRSVDSTPVATTAVWELEHVLGLVTIFALAVAIGGGPLTVACSSCCIAVVGRASLQATR